MVRRHVRAAASLGLALVAGCFNPTGQVGATTGTSGSTGPGSTVGPSGTAGTAGTGEPTTGGCAPCSSPRPYCLPDGQCGGCEELPLFDMSCGALEPGEPFCREDGECVECLSNTECFPEKCRLDTGTCVECLLDGDCAEGLVCDSTGACVGCVDASDCLDPEMGVCDEDSQTCRRCVEHEDCPQTACELDTGVCFPSETGKTHHLYVAPSDPGCEGGACAANLPCCELLHALNEVGLRAETFHVIHVAPGMNTLPAALAVDGKRVAVLAEPGFRMAVELADTPAIALGHADPMVASDSKLFVAGVEIAGGASSGAVSCTRAPLVWLDRVTVTDHAGASIRATECRVRARRSSFIRNAEGVMASSSGTIELENAIVAGVVPGPAVQVNTLSQIKLLYSTIGDRSLPLDALLACDNTTAVEIRDSVLVSDGAANPQACLPVTLTVTHTASTSPAIALDGFDNRVLLAGEAQALFVDWMNDDLHLVDDGILGGLAVWDAATDPRTDIEGALRPAVDGASDVAGADLPGSPMN